MGALILQRKVKITASRQLSASGSTKFTAAVPGNIKQPAMLIRFWG
ncbi:hypothetical protein PY364_14685 [Kamptonema sp. UHCC 0994]|nr:hypothetical protein [Kamptonema sp. UHCC 0994]